MPRRYLLLLMRSMGWRTVDIQIASLQWRLCSHSERWVADGRFEQDIVVGERGLAILADGGTLNLDARGRERAAEIAETVRLEAFRASQTDRLFDS
jgi:hypothetical protein